MEPEKLLEALHTAEKLNAPAVLGIAIHRRDGMRAWPSTAGALR